MVGSTFEDRRVEAPRRPREAPSRNERPVDREVRAEDREIRKRLPDWVTGWRKENALPPDYYLG